MCVSGEDTRARRVETRGGFRAGVSGGGVLGSHVHATAASHWQSAAYIAGEVARRLSAGASWSRVSGGYLALLAREAPVAGLRVRCAGRLAGRSRGAARARALNARWGRTALHTLRRPVDYATAVAATGRGTVGVKVWLAYHPRPG
jgi:ribosomal protein S3